MFWYYNYNNKKINQPIANTKNNNDNNNKPTANHQPPTTSTESKIKNLFRQINRNSKEEIFRAHRLIFLQSKLQTIQIMQLVLLIKNWKW